MSIVTKILLTYFATMTPTADGVRDLCEVVSRETSTPVICDPHRAGAPILDAEVCCAGSDCFTAASDSCRDGETRYYCELGEADLSGAVDCYFEVPDYCESFQCDPQPPGYVPQPVPSFICCEWGVCTELVDGSGVCPPENIYWCQSIANNGDGTLDCVDWE